MQTQTPSPRILKQTKTILLNEIQGFLCQADPYNFHRFFVTITGPEGSCYQSGIFRVEILLPWFYPMDGPVLGFLGKIYHPAVDSRGRVSLGRNWSPTLNLRSVLYILRNMLTNPQIFDPAYIMNEQAATLWTKNQTRAQQEARNWTKKYAQPKSP